MGWLTLFAAALVLAHMVLETLPVARFHPICEDPLRRDYSSLDYPDEFQVRGRLHPAFRAAVIAELIREDEHIRVVGATGPIYVTGALWVDLNKRAWITRSASYRLLEREIAVLPREQRNRVEGWLLMNFDKACEALHPVATTGKLPAGFLPEAAPPPPGK